MSSDDKIWSIELDNVESIVHVKSEDGFHLAGALIAPQTQAKAAVVWIHGVSLGFAEPEYVLLGKALAAHGIAFVTGETRGHGFGSWLRGEDGSKLGGSAWELLSEAPADLAAWLTFANGLGCSQVILAGHGWGASKAIYHIAERGALGVQGVALISSGSLVRDPLGPDLIEKAAAMVESGHGLDLMPWGVRPGLAPSTVSAQVYASRARLRRELYGDGVIRPALSRVALPMLATFGDREGRPKGEARKFLDSIRRNATTAPSVETHILRGAAYLYTGFESKLAALLAGWIDALSSEKPQRKPHGSPAEPDA